MAHSDAAHYTNRLAGETSPYLLQHAHNPVDWYPWGAEALERARQEEKPIFLSIGYSACHWCHVMERESFEDPSIAELMNRWFVSVKVDREERPDLDSIYMQAVQTMNQGQGGWPMSVFLTPEGIPFWGGTYFPPADRFGMPSFRRVLETIQDAWANRRAELLGSGQRLAEHLASAGPRMPVATEGALDVSVLVAAAKQIVAQYEPRFGGFGQAPKFPQPMAIEFLLRHWARSGNAETLNVVQGTLDAMARGGMYDQVGGGFHRYSTDPRWLVPHFEKMLYDNAQLARAYLMAYQATGQAEYRAVAEQVLDYVLRDMSDPSGGFYSTEDADSEGEEGLFYLWSSAELRQVLGDEDAQLFGSVYGVTESGNFENSGKSILHLAQPLGEAGALLGLSENDLRERLAAARRRLLHVREDRVRPGKDTKVLSAWNGMMLRAFAEAARICHRDEYRAAAIRNGEFLLTTMRAPDGRVWRTWSPGRSAHLNGYLEDSANVADGLVALYEATFDAHWLSAALEIVESMLQRFGDPEGGLFDTSFDHETLFTRPKDVLDNATPSGQSVAADVLLRLAALLDRADFRDLAERLLSPLRQVMGEYPLAVARSLSATDFLLDQPKEIAIVGVAGAPDTEALVTAAFGPYLPNKVVAGMQPGDAEAAALTPLLADREMRDGRATAYVCQRYVCQAPVTTAEALAQLLRPLGAGA